MGLFSSRTSVLDLLQKAGYLKRAQVKQIEELAQQKKESPTRLLIERKLIDENRLLAFLADRVECPSIGIESLHIDEDALRLVPAELLAMRDILPLKKQGPALTVAMADPTDSEMLQKLAEATRLKIRPMLAPASALAEMHERLGAVRRVREGGGEDPDWFARYQTFFESLEDYRLENFVGKGGFGVVCRCWQPSLERPVAVKVLNPDWNPVHQVAERFKREGQIIARLDHPFIVKVYEQGELRQFRYIVMEYFEGEPLNKYLHGQDWGRTLTVMSHVCKAIHYAHQQGVIHRDLKPGNILANAQGAVKLLDFGVAHYDAAPGGVLTGPNLVLGTPKYMAPEISRGAEHAGAHSDLYAFGVMAYEILTGERFEQGMLGHPSQLNPNVPKFLGDRMLQCLSPDQNKRPASFEVMADAFQKAMDLILFGGGSNQTPPAGTAQSKGGHAKPRALEQSFEFREILRQDKQTRTVVAFNHKIGSEVVIKIRTQPHGSQYLAQLAELAHPSLVEMFGVGGQEAAVLTITERLPGGSLANRIGREIAPPLLANWMESIVEGLRYLEKLNLFHGNLHPRNVLITGDEQVKLSDMALMTQRPIDFPQYRMDREPGSIYTDDRHAFGVMVWEMLTTESWPVGMKPAQAFKQIANDPRIHPLMKYFLGRYWNVQDKYPPYPDWDAMLADIERIRNRLREQSDWMSDNGRSPAMDVEATISRMGGPVAELPESTTGLKQAMKRFSRPHGH